VISSINISFPKIFLFIHFILMFKELILYKSFDLFMNCDLTDTTYFSTILTLQL
jgi:hypothetical protein